MIVASRGDDELLALDGRNAQHFLQTGDGAYAGRHPIDSEEAIAHLELLRERGAAFFLLPSSMIWWLDHYREFTRHLERRSRLVERDEDACLVFALED